jgi:RNA polymerase sigma-70 factor (ECF subfamily)
MHFSEKLSRQRDNAVINPLQHKILMASEDILKRAQRLESKALVEIHDQYYPHVYRYVRYRLSDEHACEDITSEVFLRLLDALNKKSGPTQNLRGWLFGTASNLVNDYLRVRYARPFESVDADDFDMPGREYPEDSYEDEWMQQQVVIALQDLTPEQQHVLALRFSEERSVEETANIMGKSITAVKALQFRAIASLRRLVEARIKDR